VGEREIAKSPFRLLRIIVSADSLWHWTVSLISLLRCNANLTSVGEKNSIKGSEDLGAH
jgi:hypothetical protein